MDIEEIKSSVAAGAFRFSLHAEIEAANEDLDFGQIAEAIAGSEMLEAYPDTGRGESCLLVGFADSTPIHIVCGFRMKNVVIVTVYIPGPPKFLDPWTRSSAK